MRGVLLTNMGGPESQKELKVFLSRMFNDPFILPYGNAVRKLLAWIISTARYKKSWKKYELIGGSPLVESMRKTTKALQAELGNSYLVKYAFSYSNPDISHSLAEFKTQGISEITVIPLYPQSSYTTTSSVLSDLKKVTDNDPFFKLTVQGEFYNHPGFISFWVKNIQKHVDATEIINPTLVFSAHSIPEYHILNGDTYQENTLKSAALIADKMGYHYEAAFQSGMRRGTWIGPDVKEHLKLLAEEGIDNLVLIPISFVHENLETRFDLDLELLPYAKEVLGFSNVSRVQLPEADPLFISMLAEIVQKK